MTREERHTDYARVRRQDRAVQDDAWIREFLQRAPYGVLATATGYQPFLNANTFVYDDGAHAIYMHTAREGRTPANIKANPHVCFMVSEMGRLLPAEKAMEFSCEYAGVIVFGRAELIQNEEEARRALQMLLDKYFPHLRLGDHYRPASRDELDVTAVFRIRIEQWSGKQKREAARFPGAFPYGNPPEGST
jgi:nitroimidazol reductase NimA-like FMN-containing flavoprotein (pyridoxamine 5'-phosphate oxidase superfamily)